MNPTSSLTYFHRNKRQAMLLFGLIVVATLGLYVASGLSLAIFVEPLRLNSMFLIKFSVVYPGEEGPDPALMAQVRSNPDVERELLVKSIQIAVPQIMGGDANWLYIMAPQEDDLLYLLDVCDATLEEGELLSPRENGILLSRQVATSLGLEVGDEIHNSMDPMLFGNIVDPLQVVGILDSELRLAIASYEYMESHEVYSMFPTAVLVVARDGRREAVEQFLTAEAQISNVHAATFQGLERSMAAERRIALSLFVPVVAMAVVVIAFVVGVVNRITFGQRLGELGVLNALGRNRGWLTRRLFLETAVLASVGWAVGIVLSLLALYIIREAVFAPRGHELDLLTLPALLLTLPVPIAAVGLNRVIIGRVLSRLDAVAVVERRQMSLESQPRQRSSSSHTKPLASRTFYSRHARRAGLLVTVTALAAAAVVFVVLIFSTSYDAQLAGLGYLRYVSRVSARAGATLDQGMATRLMTYPEVERVIPMAPRYAMLSMLIPPMGENANASPLGLYAEDIEFLVDLMGLELLEGHLPRANTNEMVIPEVLAQNRDLHVGDVVGDPDAPAYPGASLLPAEFVISGIFARFDDPEEENWLGFYSLEFVESHEEFNFSGLTSRPLLVVPRDGQLSELNRWIENEFAGEDVMVMTYDSQLALQEESARSLLLTIGLLEGVVAGVAALGLAVVNYVYVSQRWTEFGVLNALGHGRSGLVSRSVREAAFTTGLAWILCAVLCLAGLAYFQVGLFAPMGLRLDLFSPVPWLFTLPIPTLVLAVTAGTVARTLSKLDPVSIIERRV